MSGRAVSATVRSSQSAIDRWLSDLGFSRGNPFGSVEADQERILLPEFFIDVDGYEQIKGHGTVIVFAPRGGGKSALRCVLSSYAAPTFAKSSTLAVEYTDFDLLIAKQRSEQVVTIDDHITGLLRSAAKALFETFCPPVGHAVDDHPPRAERAAAVRPPARDRLAYLLRRYHPTLIEPQALYEQLIPRLVDFTLLWREFFNAATERRLRTLLSAMSPNIDPVADLLIDLNDAPDLQADPLATPLAHLENLRQACHGAGLSTIHFLIDRLDEYVETAADLHTQVVLIEPLLAHLPLLELPHVAFKFFLSREVRDLILQRITIRRDRLTDQAVHIEWDKAKLKDMLDERLEVYSESAVHSIQGLFTGNQSPPEIEAEMLQLAQGSPRRLLVAAQLLCQAHIRRVGPRGLLEKADWETAKKELVQKMPPLLRLTRAKPVAWIGDQEKKLTATDHKILLVLAEGNGTCTRDELILKVWGEGGSVNDQAVDQAIRRLRERLEEKSDLSLYLITERGRGFTLQNYEFE